MDGLRQFDCIQANRALVGTRFGGKLEYFESVSSTSSMLLEAAAADAPEGTVYVAGEQTAGRGRGGHEWQSAAGEGLYVSALIRSPLPLREALWISLCTGLAAQQALRDVAGVEIDIRWPNDLLLNRKKTGGILVETAVDGPMLRYAVIGIGINVNHAALPAELAPIATSVRMVTGRALEPATLLVALLRALDLEVNGLEGGGAQLLDRFTRASTWVHGKRVHVAEAGGYTGVTAGLDPHGFLRVSGDDGAEHIVLSGGVREA